MTRDQFCKTACQGCPDTATQTQPFRTVSIGLHASSSQRLPNYHLTRSIRPPAHHPERLPHAVTIRLPRAVTTRRSHAVTDHTLENRTLVLFTNSGSVFITAQSSTSIPLPEISCTYPTLHLSSRHKQGHWNLQGNLTHRRRAYRGFPTPRRRKRHASVLTSPLAHRLSGACTSPQDWNQWLATLIRIGNTIRSPTTGLENTNRTLKSSVNPRQKGI